MNVESILCFVLFASLISCKYDPQKTDGPLDQSITNAAVAKKDSEPTKNHQLKQLDIEYCMGKFAPDKHSDFELIPIQYADREGMYLRKDVLKAFVHMFEAASKDGVNLQIRSATRNFDYQKGIWERKWTGANILSDGTNVDRDLTMPKEKSLKILEYSSMPGTSRHHWGTDIDLNAFSNAYFENGEGKLIYDWLEENAAKYGFCQPYTTKGPDRPNGYNEEKWHWSYQPLGKEITAYAKNNLKNQMITGFKGAETAVEIDVVGNYVLGINQECNH